MAQVLPRQTDQPAHEELFVELYDRMFAWALRITHNEREQAEDLVHDTFILFALSCNVESIRNVEGYLYTMLRNLHLARVRQASQLRSTDLSIVDYDSALISLRAWSEDVRGKVQAEEELWRVCKYACLRKETAKAGSVLILRFFLGYYPSEIAAIAQCTRQAVEKRLHLARAEARVYLEEPGRIGFISAAENDAFDKARGYVRCATNSDFVTALQYAIFETRNGVCRPPRLLEEMYNVSAPADGVDCRTLAHLVSCPRCLGKVNERLGLISLSDRHPTDTIGPAPSAKGGSGGSPSSLKSTHHFQKRVAGAALTRFRLGLLGVIEHVPKELYVSVNGFVVGSQRVSSELCDQTLNIQLDEKIGFVAVYSEQGIPLLLLNVEHPPEGAPEITARVALSGGRTIDVMLSFAGTWPVLNVTYRDPDFQATISEPDEISIGESPALSDAIHAELLEPERSKDEGRRFRVLYSWVSRIRYRLTQQRPKPVYTAPAAYDVRPLVTPGRITAVLTFALLAVFVLMRGKFVSPGQQKAESILYDSVAAENALLTAPEKVLHRSLRIEERDPATGHVRKQHKIEIWCSAERGLKTRRLYDERSRLIAGEWLAEDGVAGGPRNRTVYRSGASFQSLGAEDVDLDETWRLEPSAKVFAGLIGNVQIARVEESRTAYTISYDDPRTGPVDGRPVLIKASLKLKKADLHASDMTLVVLRYADEKAGEGSGGMLTEYHIVEIGFEQKTPGAVPSSVFEPEPELLSKKVVESFPAGRTVELPARPPLQGRSAVATAETEIQVLELLSRAGADLGGEVSVLRTPGGALRVEAIVDSNKRKAEVLDVLSSVVNNPAVDIRIETPEEARARLAAAGFRSGPVVVQRFETAASSIPAHGELRRYFSGELKGADDVRVHDEINRFADRALSRSQDALVRAHSLKRLVGGFSIDEIRSLEGEARVRWLSMLVKHAGAVQQETRRLRQQLEPIFFQHAPYEDRAAELDIVTLADLNRAAERLVELTSAHDRAVRSAFAVSSHGPSSGVTLSQSLWHSFRGVEKIAASIMKLT